MGWRLPRGRPQPCSRRRTPSRCSSEDEGWEVLEARAAVYHGPGNKDWEKVADPTIVDDTDAIIRVDAVTICGTDLHILKGDVPTVTEGRILGHEAVGTVEEVGSGVKTIRSGD